MLNTAFRGMREKKRLRKQLTPIERDQLQVDELSRHPLLMPVSLTRSGENHPLAV